MKVLIVGAGIGGLVTALCLQRQGYQVQLFEQAKQILPIGAGLQLGANASRVLDYLGLLRELRSLAVEPERVDFRSYKSGGVLHSVDLGSTYLEAYDSPYMHIHRADLHRVLLAALTADSELLLNSKLQSFKETDRNVTITLDDGRTFTGDCLIGADGAKSVVRNQLLSNERSKFTAKVAWRGVVPVENLPTNFMDKVVTNFVGPNKHIVIYYLRQQQLVNFVGVIDNSQWTDSSWVSKAPWQELKNDFKEWHPTVQAVIDGMDRNKCYRWALFDQKPIKNWSSKRVSLLGDAAHSTLPFLASGAAMAIEDARVLQRSLDQENKVDQALQLYQRNRYARTAKIQSLSKSVSKLYHIRNPLLLKLAFKAVKFKSAETERFLASYDANTTALQ